MNCDVANCLPRPSSSGLSTPSIETAAVFSQQTQRTLKCRTSRPSRMDGREKRDPASLSVCLPNHFPLPMRLTAKYN